MFFELFYGLRDEGVPVAIQEWMMLMRALAMGQHGSSLDGFYHVARACLVKSETYFDAFDRVFARIFKGVEGELSVPDQLLEELSRDELLRRYLETLERQTERHDGGGRWIGTGGHSPFGHGGEHPTGIRVGGQSQRKSAMKVAEERHFKDYRTDETLDLRGTQ